MVLGSVPVKLLNLKSIAVRALYNPMKKGTLPPKLPGEVLDDPATLRYTKDIRKAKDAGMEPVKLFPYSDK